MQKIKLLKDYLENKAGDVIEVTRNTAHTLIESGKGTLQYTHRMFTSENAGASEKKKSRNKKWQ